MSHDPATPCADPPPASGQAARSSRPPAPLPRRPRRPRAPPTPRPVLIVDWRRAWRMLSVQAAAVAVTLGLLPPDQQAALLAAIGVPAERLPLALGLLFLAARLLHQGALHPAEPPTSPPPAAAMANHPLTPAAHASHRANFQKPRTAAHQQPDCRNLRTPNNPGAPAQHARQDPPR